MSAGCRQKSVHIWGNRKMNFLNKMQALGFYNSRQNGQTLQPGQFGDSFYEPGLDETLEQKPIAAQQKTTNLKEKK